jgi:hypothetical protein
MCRSEDRSIVDIQERLGLDRIQERLELDRILDGGRYRCSLPMQTDEGRQICLLLD